MGGNVINSLHTPVCQAIALVTEVATHLEGLCIPVLHLLDGRHIAKIVR